MLKPTICLLLLLALFHATTAQRCSNHRVAVYKTYYTNFCYNKLRKCVNYRTFKVRRYKTRCSVSKRRCGQTCRWYATSHSKCTKVKKPYWVYKTITRTHRRRVCSWKTENKTFWNYKRCVQCSPKTWTTKHRIRKCAYKFEKRCTRHLIRRRKCVPRYVSVRSCKSYFSHYTTYRKKYISYTTQRFCKRVRRCRRTYRYVRKCNKCSGIPAYYDQKVLYRSAVQFRRRAIEKCSNKDLYTFYSCVFDRAHGELNTAREAERVRSLIYRKRGGYATCTSTGDPHLRSFCGATFNAYRQDKHSLLYQSRNIRISTETKWSRWGKRSINSKVTVQVGKSNSLFVLPTTRRYRHCKWDSVFTSRGGSSFKVIKKTRSYRKYQSTTCRHNIIITVHARGYIDVYVQAPKAYAYNAKGLCGLCNVRGNFSLSHIYAIKFKSACARKRIRWAYCKRRCGKPASLLKCLKDAA